MHTQLLSHVQLFVTPWTVDHQAPLSMEFSRQEYWSGLPFPTPGDLQVPGIKPTSFLSLALAGRFFTIRATGMYLIPTSNHGWFEGKKNAARNCGARRNVKVK